MTMSYKFNTSFFCDQCKCLLWASGYLLAAIVGWWATEPASLFRYSDQHMERLNKYTYIILTTCQYQGNICWWRCLKTKVVSLACFLLHHLCGGHGFPYSGTGLNSTPSTNQRELVRKGGYNGVLKAQLFFVYTNVLFNYLGPDAYKNWRWKVR